MACIIGVARQTWRGADAPEPLSMWEDVARSAAADAGADLATLDSIDVVYSQSWQYDDPAGRLAERLGATPTRTAYSGIGGSVPLRLAGAALRRNHGLALLVGAEALATVRRLKKAGEKPAWSHRPAERRPFPMDPIDPSEIAHMIFEAYLTFALFDSAERAAAGRSLEAHRQRLGDMLAPMTAVAAADPDHAWFPTARTASEIITPTPENRMVAYPYTKTMVAIMDIDMAAAVLIASDAVADELHIPADTRIYLRGEGYAEDPAPLAAHPDLSGSPAMAAAATAALGGGPAPSHLDLYSCFGSSLTFATNAAGIDPLAQPLTVTGGLPYHGGPGSNYGTHSLATMVERLRAEPGSTGLVSGVGMHMQKHAFGLLSTDPGPLPSEPAPSKAPSLEITAAATGPATIAAYTVLHGRDGSAEWAPLICDLPDGTRAYARLEATLERAETEELVGTPVTLTTADGVNTAAV